MQVHATPSPPQRKPVVLFGEVLVDLFTDREIQGGAPFNVAHHLLRLGEASGLWPVLISRVGNDERGRRLLKNLQATGLTIQGIQLDPSHPTGVVLVREGYLSEGHRFEIGADQAWDFIQFDANLVTTATCPQWIYFGTLAQRADSHLALRSILQAAQVPCFLDINLRDPWIREDVLHWSFQQAEVIKVSEEELLRIAKMFGFVSHTPLKMGEQLVNAFDIRELLVTKGEQGAWVLTRDGAHAQTSQPEIHNNSTRVVDTVGAGDAFAAVYLLGLILKWPMQLALDRAHHFAAQICTVRGAIPDNPDFYDPFILAWQMAEEQQV